MERKRTAEEKREHLLNKIKKLERRVRKLSDSESEDENDKLLPPQGDEWLVGDTDDPVMLIQKDDITQDQENTEEEALDANILEILGVAPPVQPKREILHKEIAERWTAILEKGLKKEEKEEIDKQYPAFDNCKKMVAPKLNPEVSVALNESARKRDQLIESRQKQLSTILSCLGSAIQLCIKNNEDKENRILKKISDAARLLCDSFYLETRGRRSLILSIINKNLKDDLMLTEPQAYLFGENLTEKIKTAKSVQKSGQDLKVSENTKKVVSRPNTSMTPKNNTNRTLNWRGPPRLGMRTQRTDTGGPTFNRRPYIQKDKKKDMTAYQHNKK